MMSSKLVRDRTWLLFIHVALLALVIRLVVLESDGKSNWTSLDIRHIYN